MTDHPHDLLAGYVDGSLAPSERAELDAHLETCLTCREEATLASSAVDTLRALPEAEPPAGLGIPAIREARRRPGRGVPAWAAWSAAAAAAVVLGLVAFATFSDRGDGEEAASPATVEEAPAEEPGAAAEDAGEPEPASRAVLSPFRTSDQDHDAASLQRLARELRDDVRTALDAGFAPTPEAFYQGFDPEALPEPATDALGCVTQAFSPDRSVVPFLVERSSFEGDPAYVSAFLQGPSPATRYDRLLMIVADEAECSLRSYASQRL
jgi:hypothetical protein